MGLALFFAQPMLLVGSAGVFAWLLGVQVAFVRAIRRFDDSLVVEQAFDRPTILTDEDAIITVVVDGESRGLAATVKARPSAGLDTDSSLRHSIDDPLIGVVRSPVAGTHRLHPAEITVRDMSGLFVEHLRRGPEPELSVEPREPRNVHIGEGGDTVPVAFGEHAADAAGSGITPAELREYTGGEAASRIDWKATARLGTPYVREYEAESDLTTVLVVDQRGELDVGREGETVLDYLRDAAISYLAVAQSLGDPVGYYGVTDDRVHRLVTSSNAPRNYERIRRRLLTLEAATTTGQERSTAPISHRSPTLDIETEFGRTLQAFDDGRSAGMASADPLVAAVRAATATQQGTVQVVLFTDDTDRAGLQDAIVEARHRNNPVTVFIAPVVCYERGSIANLRRATERYREFEMFRRKIADIEGVTAFEVAPRERIETLLEAESEARNATR